MKSIWDLDEYAYPSGSTIEHIQELKRTGASVPVNESYQSGASVPAWSTLPDELLDKLNITLKHQYMRNYRKIQCGFCWTMNDKTDTLCKSCFAPLVTS